MGQTSVVQAEELGTIKASSKRKQQIAEAVRQFIDLYLNEVNIYNVLANAVYSAPIVQAQTGHKANARYASLFMLRRLDQTYRNLC